MTTFTLMEPSGDFHNPLRLLMGCHRRVECFLDALIRAVEAASGAELTTVRREALERPLRYFQTAAALHTVDEEVSLFPRLRELGLPALQPALQIMDSLEREHRVVATGHAEVALLGKQWLKDGVLPVEATSHLLRTLRKLRVLYQKHITIEDTALFPLAALHLPPAMLEVIGAEMAWRRGVDPDLPSALTRCADRRAAREGFLNPSINV